MSLKYLNVVLSSEALCARYIRSCCANDETDYAAEAKNISIDVAGPNFLTVIVRTQGKRIEPLREALLCLCAQSCQEFVVYLMCHKVDPENYIRLRSLVDSLPGYFRNRVELISVERGGRSHPLNVALGCLQTEYFVALDDDDLVFDNWVESFKLASSDSPGTIAHCGVYTQEWEIRETLDSVVMSATGSPLPRYCSRFDAISQYVENQCPIMSLAFPSYLPKVFNQYFDEKLSTLEDWDYLMRSARICGVTETNSNTAIYRLWSTPGFNSHALHAPEEWEHNRLYVLEKLDSMPVLLPENSVNCVSNEKLWINQPMQLLGGSPRIEYLGESWNVISGAQVRSQYNPETFRNTLKLELSGSSVKRIRLFALESGLYTLKNVVAKVACGEDRVLTFSTLDFNSNGYLIGDSYSMLRRDSWLEICFSNSLDVSGVQFYFEFIPFVNEDLLSGTKLQVRIKAKIRKVLHRYFGR